MNQNKFILKINTEYSFSNKTIQIGDNIYPSIDIKDINLVNHTLNLKKIKNKKEYFDKIYNQLSLNKVNELDLLLNEKSKKEYLSYLKISINQSSKYVNDYFLNIFPKRLTLFDKLTKLENCDIPVYDHNSSTGRLKIVSGTNFLTMKVEDRKKLKHINKDKFLYEVDFKSCEPNFYIKSQNITIHDNDIYSGIMNKFNINIERNTFKRFLLSIIYGADILTIQKLSHIEINKIKQIKDFLKIEEFKSNLESEFNQHGYIKNFYGRPLLSNNNVVNHWIQSSASDFCCLAFNDYLNNNKDIEVHGIIHDAMIISSFNENININHIKEPFSKIDINTSIKRLYE